MRGTRLAGASPSPTPFPPAGSHLSRPRAARRPGSCGSAGPRPGLPSPAAPRGRGPSPRPAHKFPSRRVRPRRGHTCQPERLRPGQPRKVSGSGGRGAPLVEVCSFYRPGVGVGRSWGSSPNPRVLEAECAKGGGGTCRDKRRPGLPSAGFGGTRPPPSPIWAGAPQPEPAHRRAIVREVAACRIPVLKGVGGAGVVPPMPAPGAGVPPGEGDAAFVCSHTLPRRPGPGAIDEWDLVRPIPLVFPLGVLGSRPVGVAGAAFPRRRGGKPRSGAFPAALPWWHRLQLRTEAARQQPRPSGRCGAGGLRALSLPLPRS